MKGNLPEAEFMEMTNIHNEISYVLRLIFCEVCTQIWFPNRVKWCCGRCNTRNQVSAEKAKKKERLGDTKKGWGGGLATMGRMKVCRRKCAL